jgi:hypothetical protein
MTAAAVPITAIATTIATAIATAIAIATAMITTFAIFGMDGGTGIQATDGIQYGGCHQQRCSQRYTV